MFDSIINVLDSGWLRVGAYGIVAAQATWWGLRERRSIATHVSDWWPTYWFLSALMLVTMGTARAGGLGEFVSELGRDQARASAWYAHRRTFQAIAVLAVTAVWAVGVVVAIWRVPPRRRRYLPHVVALSSVIAFAAIRIVSLHIVDALLYRRGIAGVRFVAIIELALLAITTAAAITTSRFDEAT